MFIAAVVLLRRVARLRPRAFKGEVAVPRPPKGAQRPQMSEEAFKNVTELKGIPSASS
jgi:hypothetical protein